MLPREPRDTLELDLGPWPDLGTATRAAPALEIAVWILFQIPIPGN